MLAGWLVCVGVGTVVIGAAHVALDAWDEHDVLCGDAVDGDVVEQAVVRCGQVGGHDVEVAESVPESAA